MKKVLLICSIMLGSAIAMAQPVNTLVHNTSTYVDDYADVYTPAQEAELGGIIKSFFDTVQIALVTVNSLEGMESADYAVKLFNQWGVGSKANNGLLILIAPKERKVFASTGKGIQGDLTDLMAGKLQREVMVPELKNNNYYQGTKNLLQAYIHQLSPSAKEFRRLQEEVKAKEQARQIGYVLSALGWIGLCLFGIIVAGVISVRIRRKQSEKAREHRKLYESYEDGKKQYQKIQEFAQHYKGKLKEADQLIDLFNGYAIDNVDNVLNPIMKTEKEVTIKEMNLFIDSFHNFYNIHGRTVLNLSTSIKTLNEATVFIEKFGKKIQAIHIKINQCLDWMGKLKLYSSNVNPMQGIPENYKTLNDVYLELIQCVNEYNTFKISSLIRDMEAEMTRMEKQCLMVETLVKQDEENVRLATKGNELLKSTVDHLLTFCQHVQVNQKTKEQTRAAAEALLNKLLLWGTIATLTERFAFYKQCEKMLGGCHAAKDEYQTYLDNKRAEERREQQKRDDERRRKERERERTAQIAAAAMVAVSSSRSSSSDFSSSGFSSSSDSGSSGSSDFGGGSSDGGGAGSDF